MTKLKKSSVVFLALTVFTGASCVIHSLINGDNSLAESDYVVSLIIKYIYPTDNAHTISSITFLVRKLAHFSEFALLFSFFNCFMISHTSYKNKALAFVTLFALIFLPLLDETVQYFSPGRSPMVYDIWIDALGGAVGIIVSSLIYYIVRKSKNCIPHKNS